jgi:hypothetical protein
VDIKTKLKFKKKLANFFGGVGYFFCLLQWFWVVILYFSIIEKVALFFSTNNEKTVTKTIPAVEIGPNLSFTIIAVTITVFMILLTLYVIYKIPSTIVKTGKKIVHGTAETVTPMVLRYQHKKDSKRNHIKLSVRMIIAIKIFLIIAPLILSMMSKYIEKQSFSFAISMYISFWLAVFCALAFIIQYILSSLLAVKRQDLW